MLCSSSSSIHSPGTRASPAAANRLSSSGTLPRATAAATRTSAAVWASSTRPVAPAIVLLPCLFAFIFSLLQSSINTQLPHRLAAGVDVGSTGERGRTGPEAQRLEHGRHGERRGDRVPVSHLERHAELFLLEEGAIHALGTDFRYDTTRVGAHHLGTRPTLTGDEIGVTQHGVDDPPAPRSRLPAPQFRIRHRHALQREPVAHHAAAVHRRLD